MTLHERWDELSRCYLALHEGFPLEGTLTKILAATLLQEWNETPDIPALRETVQRLRGRVPALSDFRLVLELVSACYLNHFGFDSLDPAIATFNALRERGLRASYPLALASLHFPDPSPDLPRDSRRWFDALRELHPFLSAQDDYLFCVQLASMGRDPEDAARLCREWESELIPLVGSGNVPQLMTEILLATGSGEALLPRTKEVLELFPLEGVRYKLWDLAPEAIFLAPLAEPRDAIRTMMEGERCLRAKPGFSNLSLTPQMRLILSVQQMLQGEARALHTLYLMDAALRQIAAQQASQANS